MGFPVHERQRRVSEIGADAKNFVPIRSVLAERVPNPNLNRPSDRYYDHPTMPNLRTSIDDRVGSWIQRNRLGGTKWFSRFESQLHQESGE